MSPPHHRNADEATFLAGEYIEFWKGYGVEPAISIPDLLGRTPTPSAAQSLHPLDAARMELGECDRCGLCQDRSRLVYGGGPRQASLVFVGEAPGAEEDRQGIPFVGVAGQLLNRIIEAMGLTRDRVYVTSLVKCRPTADRPPSADEIETCLPFLHRQLAALKPRIVVALGALPAERLTGVGGTIAELRGKFLPMPGHEDVVVMATYSPELLLSQPAQKREVWEDMKKVKAKLESP